ncbi:fumarate reductase subunit FrdD [Oceanisphaera pacifica]|uniref:Fumarate reductase subunit D n=1 Tax=Oceanisphaera pacifica TaxID=2818389 RepID=A0ABS3NG45_9GAMM|nr:fumarate reductase subunit FrdD [Oceanisphaera pacifica]MBO1519568.1 fumarate reductase subunit D [Oceanisphaera pacifica]
MKPDIQQTKATKAIKRSDEPIWWALFSGGGICFAVFIPATVLYLGLFLPLGLIEISYQQAHTGLFSFWGLVFIGACIVLPAFHAAHRIRHGLHDLKVRQHGLVKAACYGAVTLLSLFCLGIWLWG